MANQTVVPPISTNANVNRGSIWRKWDLHVHTPGTAREDQFGTWEEYLDALRAETEVAVVGVTDYLSISNYKRLLAEKGKSPLGSIELLIPNVEFRLSPQTAKGHAINLHLLIDPTSPTHVEEIELSLRRLNIKYQGQPYSCTREDLIRLGAAFDSTLQSEEQKLEAGTNQFKVEFPSFREWFRGELWLREHSLVAVAAGNDGPSGLKESGWTALQEEIWRFADIVLSGNPQNRAFWLCQDVEKKDGAKKLGAPKPCVSSSDAHAMVSLFKPAENRFCWVKADATFEGLRSIVYEPDERVYIGPSEPIRHDLSRVISNIEITGSPNSGLGSLSMAFNNGFIGIIGSKGSGKSALTDFLAYGGGVDTLLDKRSFLVRAKNFVKGTEIRLTWGDGSTTNAVVGTVFPPKALVRYLSQSFVEKLCSDDYEGVDLAQEIEGVIFGHLDPTDTLNASSFTDLRDLRTRETTKDRVSISGRISSLISEDEQLRSVLREVPKKKDRVDEIAVEIKTLEGQLPVAKNETEAKAQTELSTLRQQLLKQQSNVASQKQISLGFDQLAASLERFNGEFQTFRTDFLAQASKLGITQGEIDITLSVTGQDVLAKRKSDVTAVIQQLTDSDEAPGGSVVSLTAKITALEQTVATDQIIRNQIQTIQRKISALNQELQRLQAEIVFAESDTTTRQQEIRSERLDAYRKLFESWKTEQTTLEALYQPVQEKLAGGDKEEQELDFYIRWNIDLEGWLDRGNSLFDQRKGHPFGSPDKFRECVEELLMPGWLSGDPVLIRAGMDTLLGLFKEKNATACLRQSVSHGMMLEWLFSSDHIRLVYGLRYHKTELEKLSPGTKGIVLLVLYLAMDVEDNRPLIVDQPEENLDSDSIYTLLATYFRKAKQRRQVFIITHNPNLVINTDAEQVIIATSKRTERVFPTFSYTGGALEDCDGVRKQVCNLLEGGETAFLEREKRYALHKKDKA
jgi:energy-coupling factor transporter ATP-binding protein EcfA2